MPERNPKKPPRPLGKMVKVLEEKVDFDAAKYGSSGPFGFSRQATLLHIALEAAVPLWAHELLELEKQLGPREFAAELEGRARACGKYLAEHGDALMFRVKNTSTEAFNRLAEGIACLAFCPGGVKVLGSHWQFGRQLVEYKYED